MRKVSYVIALVLLLPAANESFGQDFSNKGKDFWVAYGYHQTMNGANGGSQNMVLYFAAEQDALVKVDIPGLGYTQSYTVPANSVVTSNPIPKTGAQDARLTATSTAPENKGIHITSDKPIVAYAHIYNSSVSGATILFPTNTLGREYYSVNYTNNSNTGNANCWFYVIAADTGTTTVEITPVANIVNTANGVVYPAGVPVTINMQEGQVYNFMGQYSGFSGVDLTGSRVRSISTASGACKPIAVFSGSGRINITCNGASTSGSSDNYMSQAFPKTAWGKKYLTIPASGGNSFNIYRICVSDPATVVRINGVITTLPLTGNFYYEIAATNQPQLIEADQPILVAQYFTSQNQCGNMTGGQLGDPEVIYLSPVEQNINKVLWNATPNFNITQHYFNVIIPNTGTALTSFLLDGFPVAPGSFLVHPQDPAYSYLAQNVLAGQHIIQSDSGFNAIAYGFGNAESYGYNAGTNIKDIYRYISVDNQYAAVDFPAACKGSPFSLAMTFPYQPTQIIWDFNGLFPNDTINNPVFTSTVVVNGRTLYKYALTGTFSVPAPGIYPIRIIAHNPTADGCSGVQEIDYDLQIFDLPGADFNFTTNGCVSSPVLFTDNSTNNSGRPITQRHWNFGDGNTANNVASTSHTYAGPGSYTVKYSIITDIGCKSDTMPKTVVLNDPPVAGFTPVAPFCAGKTVTFSDNSSVATGAITKWTWNFGDGSPVVTATTNAPQTHTYANTGPYTVSLQVETASGCVSGVTQQIITVHPNPVVAFTLPVVCLPVGAAQFNSNSTISDGTQSQFTYLWNFGDASPNATVQNPLHNYTGVGPYNVSLTVTSNNGCATMLSQNLATIYAEPKAVFPLPAEVCLGTTMNFTDQSTAAGSSVTQWLWNFGDATTATTQNPSHTYTAAGTYTVTLSVTSAVGCQSVSPANIATQTVTVNALPTAGFNVSLPGCVGQGVTFTSTSVPNSGTITKWTWNYGDATPPAVATNGNPLVHTYSAINSYPVTLQVETDKGCISSVFPVNVVINAVPDAGFISPEICVSDNLAPFTDTSKISSGSISTWEWNFGDPNANAGNPNISTLQNPTHHYTLPGSYTAQLIATSNAGCKDTTNHPVNVNGAVLAPQFSVENAGPLCSNTTVSIKDASTIDAGNILRVEIYWDAADPTNKTVDNTPAPGKTYSHAYPEFGSPATRTYTVRYEVWSGINCVNSVTRDITLLATPQLAFGSVLPVCDNIPAFQLSQVQLINNLPGSGVFSGTGVSSTGMFDPDVAGEGTHTITYTYTGTNGCVNSSGQDIIVNPSPVADAGPDKFVLEGGYIVLTPKLVTNIPVSYSWTPATYLNDPAIASPQASPPTDFTYTLTVTSDKGCVNTDEVFVKLLKSLVIPNIFSPNGDGVNDRWVIKYLDSYPGCVIQIYNRYGQLVQRFVNYISPWDGKINGQDAPIGTYYYVIDPKNGGKPVTGYVDIIR
ncbi:MAG: PKD domain-containing protein [Chitinophagaceae bacterium]|nr:PKD domain-containing protein [Chitinophagaceae bacterium]